MRKHPQRCAGMLRSASGDVLPQLDPVLRSFGLEPAVEAGPYCGVYRGASIDFISTSTPGKDPYLQAFDVGATDATKIRRLLGEVATNTSLELKIYRWDPPLP